MRRYLRYVDDFCCFADDKAFLVEMRHVIREFLFGLRVRLNEGKSRIRQVTEGIEFLGFVVLPVKTGIQALQAEAVGKYPWIPTCAGMTKPLGDRL